MNKNTNQNGHYSDPYPVADVEQASTVSPEPVEGDWAYNLPADPFMV